MAAPAGTERSRPAASEPINGSAGAAAEHIHAATAGIVAAEATEPALRATPKVAAFSVGETTGEPLYARLKSRSRAELEALMILKVRFSVRSPNRGQSCP